MHTQQVQAQIFKRAFDKIFLLVKNNYIPIQGICHSVRITIILFSNDYSATLSMPLLASIFHGFFFWHQGDISAFLGKMAKLAIIIVYFVELDAAENRVENLTLQTCLLKI